MKDGTQVWAVARVNEPSQPPEDFVLEEWILEEMFAERSDAVEFVLDEARDCFVMPWTLQANMNQFGAEDPVFYGPSCNLARQFSHPQMAED